MVPSVRRRGFRGAVRCAAPLLALLLVPFLSSRHGALQAQMAAPATGPFYGGHLVATGDWLQANALPLNRNAMHSVAFDLSYRRDAWVLDGGFLRIARDLSTVQGGFLSGGPQFHWNRLAIIPSVGALIGVARASADSTGYNYVTTAGVSGHTPRYDYSSATTFGGGLGLTLEVPIYGPLNARATAGEWVFSGDPVANERTRTILGAGLSLRVW